MFSHKSVSEAPNIKTVEGDTIEVVDLHKYLGIWLDKNLDFKHHITYLMKY